MVYVCAIRVAVDFLLTQIAFVSFDFLRASRRNCKKWDAVRAATVASESKCAGFWLVDGGWLFQLAAGGCCDSESRQIKQHSQHPVVALLDAFPFAAP